MEHRLETLYKRTSKGKLQQWEIRSETRDDGHVYLVTYHGQADGKMVLSAGTRIKGKNIGKANETTPWEQAKSEAESKWQKKVDDGYVTDPKVAMEQQVLLPVLAKKWVEQKRHIQFPCLTQPKLDGVRCMAMVSDNGDVKLLSRKGKEYLFLDHIREDLRMLAHSAMADGVIFDGELYSHEMSLQEIVSCVRKSKTEPDPEMTVKIEYVIYDVYLPEKPEVNYKWRHDLLQQIFAAMGDENKCGNVKLLPCRTAYDEAEVDEDLETYVSLGFEGCIIRDLRMVYKLNGRSKHLLKYKRFIEDEFEIIGAKEAEGNDAGTVVWICNMPSVGPFNVRPRGAREQRKLWWERKEEYFGKLLTVRFFDYTDDGLPHFGVGVAIRDYE